MTTERVDLTENGPAEQVTITSDISDALNMSQFVTSRRVSGTGRWSVGPVQFKVGSVGIVTEAGDRFEVHVRPKIPITRVIFLMDYAQRRVNWRTETVNTQVADDLLCAVVEAFERITTRALQRGLPQGYRTVEQAQPVVRGRIREADQLRQRYGLPVPVEVRYDDYSVDTPENRLLRAAVTAARQLPRLTADLRLRLLRLDGHLAAVTPMPARKLEPWRLTHLNLHFSRALRLAETILAGSSFEPPGDGLVVTGFVLDMSKVFEDFVCCAIGERLERHGGRTTLQAQLHLDVERRILMKPDLVWYADEGQPLAVVDAKYKTERRSGFKDADPYQLLAYCVRLGLPVGHLVYAKGDDAGRTAQVAGTGITLQAHAVDLTLPPRDLLSQVDLLVDKLVNAATRSSIKTPGSA